jgi:hypothetical protein
VNSPVYSFLSMKLNHLAVLEIVSQSLDQPPTFYIKTNRRFQPMLLIRNRSTLPRLHCTNGELPFDIFLLYVKYYNITSIYPVFC